MQVIEDAHCLLPGLPCSLYVAGGAAGVTQVGEDLGFVETVTEFPEQTQCALVTVGGVAMVADLVLDVAEAVPDVCLAAAVPQLMVQGQGLPAERAGLLGLAEQRVAIADGVERSGLPGSVPGGPEQAEGLFGLLDRVRDATLAPCYQGQRLVGPGLAEDVAEFAVQ